MFLPSLGGWSISRWHVLFFQADISGCPLFRMQILLRSWGLVQLATMSGGAVSSRLRWWHPSGDTDIATVQMSLFILHSRSRWEGLLNQVRQWEYWGGDISYLVKSDHTARSGGKEVRRESENFSTGLWLQGVIKQFPLGLIHLYGCSR